MLLYAILVFMSLRACCLSKEENILLLVLISMVQKRFMKYIVVRWNIILKSTILDLELSILSPLYHLFFHVHQLCCSI